MHYSPYVTIIFLMIQGIASLASRQKRLVRAEDAQPGEFPYQVSIRNTFNHAHHCGGIILNENNVLTAAHCLNWFSPDDFEVVTGTVDLTNIISINQVSDIYVHENYDNRRYWKDDIALLKVADRFTFDGFSSPARLPNQGDEIPLYTKALVSGFGRTASNSDSSKNLKKLELNIHHKNYCQEKWKSTRYKSIEFTDDHICAYDFEPKGICRGDSGGPLTVNGIVMGIASFTNNGCADTNFPSIFTKISSYVDWINTNMFK